VNADAFRLKKPEEIDKMRRSGKILGDCLALLGAHVRAGITTDDLDRIAETYIRDKGCVPGFLGYQGFPKSLCVSVNEEVVHGIPGQRIIEDGDIVSLDCGLILDGWWADSGWSVICGIGSPEHQRLVEVTRQALELGIAAARPGNHVGHGIGRNMHEPPQVPNYGQPGMGNQLKPGYVLAIEPMVNSGKAAVRTKADDWTVETVDGGWSCYFEHTVAITESGPEVLTARPAAVRAS
jgi:methionyl aminopeptidase